MKLVFLSFLGLMFALGAEAQTTAQPVFSSKLDLPSSGWNKVLLMQNGNTFLFHLEIGKHITVKVFDSLGKEIASQEHPCRVLNTEKLKEALFEGLLETNGEAALFIDQEYQSKHGLIRMLFNNKAEMVEEKRIAESPAMSTPTDFTVVNNKWEHNYAIVYATDKPAFKKCDVHITYYNANQDVKKDIAIDVPRKEYDHMAVLGFDASKAGVFLSILLSVEDLNAAPANIGMGDPKQYKNYYKIYYIPSGDTVVRSGSLVELAPQFSPSFPYCTYNPFANAINVQLLSFRIMAKKNGLDWLPEVSTSHLFLKFDGGDMSLAHNWINNTMANDYLRKQTDTTRYFDGIPVQLYTNEHGLSTMILVSYGVGGDKVHIPADRVKTYLSNIGITQYDDDGKEIFGTILPFNQCFHSQNTVYDMGQMAKKGQTSTIFGDLPEQVYIRQFYGVNAYAKDRNFYMVFNDVEKNMGNTLKNPGDTLYSFDGTQAQYYRMDRKKQISKKYLFGKPAEGEYVSSFVEGADFDEKRGVYASLVQRKKGSEVSLQMAWARLE